MKREDRQLYEGEERGSLLSLVSILIGLPMPFYLFSQLIVTWPRRE